MPCKWPSNRHLRLAANSAVITQVFAGFVPPLGDVIGKRRLGALVDWAWSEVADPLVVGRSGEMVDDVIRLTWDRTKAQVCAASTMTKEQTWCGHWYIVSGSKITRQPCRPRLIRATIECQPCPLCTDTLWCLCFDVFYSLVRYFINRKQNKHYSEYVGLTAWCRALWEGDKILQGKWIYIHSCQRICGLSSLANDKMSVFRELCPYFVWFFLRSRYIINLLNGQEYYPYHARWLNTYPVC